MKVSRGTREGREARGGRNASSLLRPSTVNDFLSWAVKTVLFYFFKKIGSNSTGSVAATHPRYHERYARGRERKILEQDTKNSLKKKSIQQKSFPHPTNCSHVCYLLANFTFFPTDAFLSDACAFCSGWKSVCVCARARECLVCLGTCLSPSVIFDAYFLLLISACDVESLISNRLWIEQ